MKLFPSSRLVKIEVSQQSMQTQHILEFEINPEACNLLDSIDSTVPLGVVSVAGMYRTGKSYLLNRVLLDRSDGFGVGPTINPCTKVSTCFKLNLTLSKGLWIWARPIAGTNSEGQPLQVLVIDTEGLGAFDETQNHDVRVFSLAILLSSYFVFNSMGTIDENTLQQLSLVVNLTKNIQLKSNVQEVKDDDLAAIFPSFMWIVRDFALKLVDQNQEKITSQEYFERALVDQKGEGESIKAKNQIRKHLRKFFPQRDCCTMIRPLANEKQLQSLSKLELTALRPEFIQQLQVVRQKILFNMKPKEMNGKLLSGSMIGQLAYQYVEAINSGSVPNIENAWSFICKQECQKALQLAIETFENSLAQVFLPVSDEDAEIYLEEAQTAAFDIFKQTAIGTDNEIHLNQLNIETSKIVKKFKEKNSAKFYSLFNIYATNNFTEIKQSLNSNQYQNVAEFQEHLDQYKQFLIENGPSGPKHLQELVIKDFLFNQLANGCQQMLSGLNSDFTFKSVQLEQQIKNLEDQAQFLKDQERETKERLQSSLYDAQIQLNQAKTDEILLQQQFNKFKEQKEAESLKVKQDQEDQLHILDQQNLELKAQLQAMQQELIESQRTVFALKSELDKNIALANQKSQFLEQQISDKSQTEQFLLKELKEAQLGHQEVIRDMENSFAAKLKSASTAKDEISEKLQDFIQQLADMEQAFTQERTVWTQSQNDLNNQVQNLKSELENAVAPIQVQKKQEEIEQLQESFSELKQTLCIYTNQNAQIKEERDQIVTRLDKEIAILKQSIEFKDQANKDLSKSLEDKTRAHKNFVQTMEEHSLKLQEAQESQAKQLQEIKGDHILQIQKLQLEHDEYKYQMENQLDGLKQQCRDSEQKCSKQVQKRIREIQLLRLQVENLESEKVKLTEAVRTLEDQKRCQLEELQEKAQTKINSLTNDLEEITKQSETQIEQLQQSAETSLAKLKSFFDMEKERIEVRSVEERNTHKKQFSEMQEEYERRINEETFRHQDDVQQLHEELQDRQQLLQKIQNQYDHMTLMNRSKIESLEECIKDKDNRLKNDQEVFTQTLDSQIEKANNEKKELVAKIESQQVQICSQDKELTTVNAQLQSIKDDLEKKKQLLQSIEENFIQEKAKADERFECIKRQNQDTIDESLQRKLEDCREIALQKQRNDFNEKTIDELRKQIDQQNKQFEEQLKVQKQEAVKEYEEYTNRYNDQKRLLEKKYEHKIRSMKEAEQTYQKRISELDRDLTVTEQKLVNEQVISQEQLQKVVNEVIQLKEQQVQVQDHLIEDRNALCQDLERMKAQLIELEKEHIDLQSRSERERLLFEGKVAFLEQQRDTAKQDLNEQCKKFENTVEQIQKRNLQDREKIESNQNQLKAGIEQRLTQQMKEKVAELTNALFERDERLKETDRENRELQTQIQIAERDLLAAQRQFDKKTNELVQRENDLRQEFALLKTDKETKIQCLNSQLAKEKEIFKQRILDIETKNREIENRRSVLLFDFEKERAKWNQENEKIKTKNSELQELLERTERKSNVLLRENEKLKNNSRQKQFGLSSGSLTARNSSASSSGALTSRTENGRTPSTLKLQFGLKSRLQNLQVSTFKENELAEGSSFTNMPKEEIKTSEKPPARSSLINVTAPFRQRQENIMQSHGVQAVFKPTIIKRLNLIISSEKTPAREDTQEQEKMV